MPSTVDVPPVAVRGPQYALYAPLSHPAPLVSLWCTVRAQVQHGGPLWNSPGLGLRLGLGLALVLLGLALEFQHGGTRLGSISGALCHMVIRPCPPRPWSALL